MKTKPKQQVTLISEDIKEIHRLTDTLTLACKGLDALKVSGIVADIYSTCVGVEKKIYSVKAMLKSDF